MWALPCLRISATGMSRQISMSPGGEDGTTPGLSRRIEIKLAVINFSCFRSLASVARLLTYFYIYGTKSDKQFTAMSPN